MSSETERHRRLRAVFDQAVLLDPASRRAFVDERCADDPDLRAHAHRLLGFHQGDSFLAHPTGPRTLLRQDRVFAGTDRFTVLSTLGAGGMGVVHAVRDEHRQEVVALKTVRRPGAADLYRFKREFRSLADVTHPNLVCLYELFVEDDRAFFTMERVDGVSFVDHVRGPGRQLLSVERLLPALRQLIAGVTALHRHGKLHRDIKPSNVLVTSGGRVVILDFGLIADAASPGMGPGAGGGTPAYMSPEEVSGAAATEAGDWYAVGVTLYEALTGSLPFDGSLADVLQRKTSSDPPSPRQAAPGVPPDLSDACMGLLQRDPARRLTGPAVLRLLQLGDGGATSGVVPAMPETIFVGRDHELRALGAAQVAVGEGGARTVTVHGPSGIGKSALLRHFVNGSVQHDRALVLIGRCYENESVPYKALDGVVDDLSRYLQALPDTEAEVLLPPDVQALARVFPVLQQVGVVTTATSGPVRSVDPLQLRRLAFAALRTLLTRLARRRSLIVWIDDLQWADADSLVLLEDLLGTDPPWMLTLLSFRSEELGAKPFLRALVDRLPAAVWSTMALGPMTEDEADRLIGSLLPRQDLLSGGDRRRMARDAAGSPFILEHLALSAAVRPADAAAPAGFAGAFEARIDALPSDARRFVEILAVCGRPLAPDVVCDAGAIAGERQSLLVRLRASRLIRSSGASDRVEAYHDRIREALAGRLAPAAVREIHGRMVATLVARGSDDCEALFEHYRGAGEPALAAVQAGLSADKANAALAFDRAASFYAQALELAAAAPSAPQWREGRALALANAGLPAAAAEAYLLASSDAARERQVVLRQRAAEQFLVGGHIDRGLDLTRSVLESVGLSAARSPRRAAVRLVGRRLRLRLRVRGLRFASRRAEDVNAETLLRLDTCWTAATGLALVDVVTASDFVARHLQLALDAGEPSRIARGLALEAAARSADTPFRRSAPRLADAGAALAEQLRAPHALAMSLLADSITACATGQWRRARQSAERTLTILQEQCVGATWETTIAQNMLLWGLMYLGELGEVCRRVPLLLADARRRGNLYTVTEVCTRSNLVWLCADDPDEGEREAMAALANWSKKGFHRQHYSARLARVQTALYRGDADSAWRLLTEQDAGMRRSMLLHVQAFRVESQYLRGRCAIALATTSRQPWRWLSVARACIRRIERERMPWSNPLARLLAGCVESVEGRDAAAAANLEAAAGQFERAEMGLYLAVTRRRLGIVRGDRRLQRQAEAWMAEQQIRNPVCFTRMLAPGFGDAAVLPPA